ncbi:MAG TPA: glycosyltransferase family 4 protein [Pedobacter sp.]|jgi:glycosyltransferase involved in cell wall biosynthesis
MHILVLNLVAFAHTGGVEKVSRILAKAISDIGMETGSRVLNLSLYDTLPDTRYVTEKQYKGFKKNRIQFLLHAIKHGKNAKHLVITHIHLAFPALIVKLFNPAIKIHIIAHGIEIWAPLKGLQKMAIRFCYQILAVSNFTKKNIADRYPETEPKIKVLNNCLDPFYQPPASFIKPVQLLEKYRIGLDEKVLITLCRLSSSEKYKGYDTVLKAMASLKDEYRLRYILLGKYDRKEYKRLLKIIEEENLEDHVILVGFVSEESLSEHLLLGDLFIMPSIKEGFGIAFIEAAAAGLPLIAGNKDGSVDALLNGQLGQLVDPSDLSAITAAIQNCMDSKPDPLKQQNLVLQHFNYETYKNNLKIALKLASINAFKRP